MLWWKWCLLCSSAWSLWLVELRLAKRIAKHINPADTCGGDILCSAWFSSPLPRKEAVNRERQKQLLHALASYMLGRD